MFLVGPSKPGTLGEEKAVLFHCCDVSDVLLIFCVFAYIRVTHWLRPTGTVSAV